MVSLGTQPRLALHVLISLLISLISLISLLISVQWMTAMAFHAVPRQLPKAPDATPP
jgi:hypothetical protein